VAVVLAAFLPSAAAGFIYRDESWADGQHGWRLVGDDSLRRGETGAVT
jgi:hypothetical protein